MAQPDERDLLPRCPLCLYRLRGLPIMHTCPECGLEFDRRWRLFGKRWLPRSELAATRVTQICLLTFVLYPAVVVGSALATSSRYLVPMNLILIGCFGLAALLVWLFTHPSRRFIAVASDAVIVWHGPKEFYCYPAELIGHARFDAASQAIVFTVSGIPVHLAMRKFFPMFSSTSYTCIHAINQVAGAKA